MNPRFIGLEENKTDEFEAFLNTNSFFPQKILYSFCSPHDVREAVLQQEVSGILK